MQYFFTPAERQAADRMAPRGSTVFSAGDPCFYYGGRSPPTIEEENLPGLAESTAAPKGIEFIVARMRKLTKWRHFCTYM